MDTMISTNLCTKQDSFDHDGVQPSPDDSNSLRALVVYPSEFDAETDDAEMIATANQDIPDASAIAGDPLGDTPPLDVTDVEVELQAIGRAIRLHLDDFRPLIRSAAKHQKEIGLKLIEAKRLCEHGRWLKFIEELVVEPRFAQQCMRIAKYWPTIEANANDGSYLTVTQAREMCRSVKKPSKRTSRPRDDRQNGSTTPNLEVKRNHAPDVQSVDSRPPEQSDETDSLSSASVAQEEPLQFGDDEIADKTGHEAEIKEPEATDSAVVRRDLVCIHPQPAPTSANRTVTATAKPQVDVNQNAIANPASVLSANLDRKILDPLDDRCVLTEEWLKTRPLRAHLLDPDYFDSEASAWRRLEPIGRQIRQLLGPSKLEVHHSSSLKMMKNQIGGRYLFAACINPPHRWDLCFKCKGRTSKTSGISCGICDGAGYLVTHEGEQPASDQED